MQIIPRPEKVNSAENALRKSINHFHLINYNFPSEATDCILQLHLALELLVKQKYITNKKPLPSDTYSLYDNFIDWDNKQKDIAHWLRKKRNELQHSGEAHWEERSLVRKNLFKAYLLTSQVYINLGYKLNEIFTPSEQAILNAKDINWMDEVYNLVQGSFKYYEDEPEIAIQISNAALENAIRGLAKSWRIKDSDTLNIPDLVQAMYDNKYVFVADIPISYEDYQTEPFFFNREIHEYCYLARDCLIKIDKVIESSRAGRRTLQEEVKKALEDNRDVVVSFIKNAPYLDYFESIVTNWHNIISELTTKIPGIIIPTLYEEYGISSWWDESKSIAIFFNEVRKAIDWEENYEVVLLEVIQNVCGEKPSDLLLQIRWADFNQGINDSGVIRIIE